MSRGWLDGRTGVVTGASRGIGQAIACRLVAEGADVALVGRADATRNHALAGARANAHNLPRHTQVVEIAGANHAQFGFYGTQINDCSPEISRTDQQRQLIDAMVKFIR